MINFTLRKIEAAQGKQSFEELIINPTGNKEKDDLKGQLKEFEDELHDTTYKSEFKTLMAYMKMIADLCRLPPTKFKDITPAGEVVREYEFKSKHIRIYCIQKHGGKIVVLCGFKNEQTKSIVKFRSLKKQYLSQQQ